MSRTFELVDCATETRARRGRLTTLHGTVETPVFMPVGTQASVKSMTPDQVRDIGAQIILGNTYHLNLRPGSGLIREMGGLHSFMNWDGPILTDSGGYQVFSLAKLRDITDEGVAFRSHLDGSSLFLGPREVMTIQSDLGSDIAMALDECPPYPCQEAICSAAVDRTVRWAAECKDIASSNGFIDSGRLVFGIVQGSTYESLRRDCAESLIEIDFSGYAVGGVSVGEPEPEMLKQVSCSTAVLPSEKPRYVMGVGTPPQLLKMIAFGADMFDCVMPTRDARHGAAFTPGGRINIRNRRFRDDPAPLVEGLDNYTCRNFSRAYLRHLVISGELLAHTLLSIHNVHFFLDLMDQARRHLEKGDFDHWHLEWIERYEEDELE